MTSCQESNATFSASVTLNRRCSENEKENENEYTTINFAERVLSVLGNLCMNELYSDVSFVVEGQRLPAHCFILAARCEYFRALLYGPLAESKERPIPLLQVPLEAFKVILGYLYSGKLTISKLNLDASVKVLRLANMYCLVEVESVITKHMIQNLKTSNVLMVLDESRRYNLNELAKECLKLVDRNSSDLLKHYSFRVLSKESLEEVLSRDTFVAPEVDIFGAVCKWSLHNPDVDINSVVSLVRLPLMTAEHLLRVVRPTGIVEPEKLLDAIDSGIAPVNLPYRAIACPGVDVTVSEKHPHRLIIKGNKMSIELSCWYKINTLHILGTYDYTVNALSCAAEVSCDRIHWKRVGNSTFQVSQTWQIIRFPAQAVRFIRIVHPETGRKNLINYVMHLKAILEDTAPEDRDWQCLTVENPEQQ
ncbi:BTB/POZ domain-containing protein 9-like [Drosophila miranda]|uniref:BTB/POZ domain-containing protein 9-like n=1 Tax=Drosophila miranda TaxID=7229 RepID=UPI0007E801E0|nr:BTB/POZ domain-containing protein 9-like [Drosophila miranda]XP_033249873.1 BTB/POZ domain-containing protein 9-like [Drosophila miranda]